jgi:hypothetical protein
VACHSLFTISQVFPSYLHPTLPLCLQESRCHKADTLLGQQEPRPVHSPLRSVNMLFSPVLGHKELALDWEVSPSPEAAAWSTAKDPVNSPMSSSISHSEPHAQTRQWGWGWSPAVPETLIQNAAEADQSPGCSVPDPRPEAPALNVHSSDHGCKLKTWGTPEKMETRTFLFKTKCGKPEIP